MYNGKNLAGSSSFQLILRSLCFFLFFSLSAEKLLILQSSDMHAHYLDGEEQGSGGFLRMARMVKKYRQQYGKENVLLIDTGDTIQGSLAAERYRGSLAVTCLNEMKYDTWVLGNHELDFGLKQLNRLVEQTEIPILAGNFRLTNPYDKFFPSWRMYQKSGKDIAVIGLQNTFLDHWFYGSDWQQYELASSIETLEKIMPEIHRAKPDLIVLAAHQGFRYRDKRGVNDLKGIAYRFPEIDLILGGHTHWELPAKRINQSFCVQPGQHGSYLSWIKVEFREREKPLLKMQLVPVKGEYDHELYEKLRPQLERIKDYEEEAVCTLAKEISSRGEPGYRNQISDLICRSMIEATGADLAIHGTLSKASLAKGVVKQKDLFKVMPYENTFLVVELSKEEIRQLIEEQQKLKWYKRQQVYGLKAYFEEDVLIRLEFKEKKEPYKVVLTNRLAAGHGARCPVAKELLDRYRERVKEWPVTSREVLRRFLKKGKGLYDFKQQYFQE